MLIYLFPIIIFISCAEKIDYFGNDVDLNNDQIYLSKIRKNETEKDKYLLIFIEQRGKKSERTRSIRAKTLKRYINLIKKINGYTKSKILKKRTRGVIEPRYYVTVKFY